MNDSTTSNESAKSFMVKDGETYFSEGEGSDWEEFGDFTLKFSAELTEQSRPSEGYWLCRCTSLVNREIVSREVVLPTSAFEGRSKFMLLLRKEFNGGTFSLSGTCTNRDVIDYYRWLKKDFEAGEQRQCSIMNFVGYQGNDYWCLSEQIHIKKGKFVAEENREHWFVKKEELQLYYNCMNEDLLKKPHLYRVMKSFIDLSDCWGVNKQSFLAAASFVCLRLMRCGDTDENAGEANIGMIYSNIKSVGKSLTAKMLAFAQGVPNVKHSQLLAGGDQVMSGTSVKKVMEALTKTTFVLVLDDAKMTENITELLLQVQGGLLQGSVQAGMDTPCGSILLTSNSKENDRLHGRVIRFPYKKEDNFASAQEQKISELFNVICENRGFLTAWAIRFCNVFKDLVKNGLLGVLTDIISSEIKSQQTRWYKGVSAVLLTHAMILMSCGMVNEEDFVLLVQNYIAIHISNDVDDAENVIRKLEKIIEKECVSDNTKDKVTTWLNPTVRVNQNGTLIHGIAIKLSKLGDWSDIGRQELVYEANKHGKSVVGTAVAFKPAVQNEPKQKKAIKFPRSIFNNHLLHLVDHVCGIRDDPPETQTSSEVGEPIQVTYCLDEEQISKVKAIFTDLLISMPTLGDDGSSSESENNPPEAQEIEVAMELTPRTRQSFTGFTPKRKRAFEMGYVSAARRRLETTEDKESSESGESIHSELQDLLDIDIENEKQQGQECASTSGTIGVTEKTYGKTRKDDDICTLCSLGTPPSLKKRSSRKLEWVQCDKCDAWFHLICSGLKKVPPRKNKWYCISCKETSS